MEKPKYMNFSNVKALGKTFHRQGDKLLNNGLAQLNQGLQAYPPGLSECIKLGNVTSKDLVLNGGILALYILPA